MKKDTIVLIHQPATARDALTEVLREGAQKLLAEAIRAEVENFLDQYQEPRDELISIYELKYPKATACLEKDREGLLAFYAFPAEHWVHLRTTNPIDRRSPR